MLALVAIFLVTLITSATAVWVYRKVSGWHGFTATLVGRSHSVAKMKIGQQQGFVQLAAKPKGQTRLVRTRTPKGGFKTPWGW